MIKFETSYFRCPKCHACLENKILKPEMVNESILFSDGKILNDGYNMQPQKMIICPSCGHLFWIEHIAEPVFFADKPDEYCYSWNTWRFYGCNFSLLRGKKALIEHYKRFLKKRSYDPKKEIYLRRLLWWAYNDLYRNYEQIGILHWLSGEMSYGVWKKNRQKLIKGIALFNTIDGEFTENLARLATLIEKYAPDEDRLTLIEIYREMKQYDKAQAVANPITRRTHFISGLVKKLRKNKFRVYKVSG